MGGMKDTLGDTPYPFFPGYKEPGGTSRLAAQAMGTSATNLRASVLNEILGAPGGLTADEVAGRLNHTVLAIRPRVTELGKQQKIVKSGRTRLNESGQKAAVWIPKPRDCTPGTA